VLTLVSSPLLYRQALLALFGGRGFFLILAFLRVLTFLLVFLDFGGGFLVLLDEERVRRGPI
jgi:hypothetical protein